MQGREGSGCCFRGERWVNLDGIYGLGGSNEMMRMRMGCRAWSLLLQGRGLELLVLTSEGFGLGGMGWMGE